MQTFPSKEQLQQCRSVQITTKEPHLEMELKEKPLNAAFNKDTNEINIETAGGFYCINSDNVVIIKFLK